MNTVEEAINFAIEKEGEMAAYYNQLGDLAESYGSKIKFHELAEMEQNHKEQLEQLTMNKVPLETRHETPDLKISDYLHDVNFTSDIKYQDVLIMAMKAEEKSHKMYLNMASNFEPGSEIYRIFDFLAEQEAKHKLTIETEYEENFLKEDY